MSGAWVQTFTGRRVELLAPDPETIAIEDISHALARINRFSGATREAYSVAQHSLHVAELVARETDDPRVILAALLHDAHEAYLGDITSPVKRAIEEVAVMESLIAMTEGALLAQIRIRFGLPISDLNRRELIRRADLVALATEKRDLFAVQRDDWGPLPEPDEKRISAIPSHETENRFISVFRILEAKIGGAR